jgi:acyl transferase domain-containing protein/acyl carrier protein
MAGRFPGARDLEAFWRNLRDGVESLVRFTDDELRAAGVDPRLITNPSFVKAGTYLERADEFDAAFFGINPREAEAMDPQHRLFLECAWAAIEDAGYDVHRLAMPVGVFAGATMNTYLLANLLKNPQVIEAVGAYQVMIGNDKDFLSTRVSYKLNLRGPSLTIQTACSTSLVAVHLACESLLTHRCDMALAGGVSLSFPQRTGYLYQEGMILSPDGKLRPFDAKGQGIRSGEGAGIVVLRRLEDALADGDAIRAVILGTAINNDGAQKVGYTAPSIDGQAEAIATAQAIAEVDPATITYIEAHGTATPVGDPIEIAALTKAFRAQTSARQFCAIGSVKSNIGHLDAAAGVAGLIKTVLALEHREIPPSLNFETPNPQIDFAASPFFVNASLRPWTTTGQTRRAGVSSFGIGGTNAHVVLEEAPAPERPIAAAKPHLLVLSARTASALDQATSRLAEHLRAHSQACMSDVAWTLQTGRRGFEHRRAVVAQDATQAIAYLEHPERAPAHSGRHDGSARRVAFLFSGQGSQHAGMGATLYRAERVYREAIDRCAAILTPHLNLDLREALFASPGNASIDETRLAQPALFTTEYALASLWRELGVEPAAMLGHSIGEYVAAHLAGVMSLEDALAVVAVRGRLMQALPAGSMAAVHLDAARLARWLDRTGVEIAAMNAPDLCTIAGPSDAVADVLVRLEREDIETRTLRTSHAFHSSMMDPALAPFTAVLEKVRLSPPERPYISNVTGSWITPAEATSPAYYARHLRGTVQFEAGMRTLSADPTIQFLEVGPGGTLATLARMNLAKDAGKRVIASLGPTREAETELDAMLQAAGRLWIGGTPLNWAALHADTTPRRVSLPTYPFESKRYWVEPIGAPSLGAPVTQAPTVPQRSVNVEDWFFAPTWIRSDALDVAVPRLSGTWLVLGGGNDLADAVAARLTAAGAKAVRVTPADAPAREGVIPCSARLPEADDIAAVASRATAEGSRIAGAIVLWSLCEPDLAGTRERLALFHAQIATAAGLDVAVEAPVRMVVATAGAQSVLDEPVAYAGVALAIGPVLALPAELPGLSTRIVDLAPELGLVEATSAASALVAEAATQDAEVVIARRAGRRWLRRYERCPLPRPESAALPLKTQGVYLITGGLGGIGLALAQDLARRVSARLLLTARSTLPPREEWDAWLAQHEAHERNAAAITAIRAIEAAGGEVIVASADVCHLSAMREAIEQARARWGSIDGVVHAAGVAGAGNVSVLKSVDDIDAVLAPKVIGLDVLVKLLGESPLDFVALMSSINSVVNAAGVADYAAANAVLDAFVDSVQRPRAWQYVVACDWGAWRDVGMATKLAVPASRRSAWQAYLHAGIDTEAGVDAFARVLASGRRRVVVFPFDISQPIQQSGARASTGPTTAPEDRASMRSDTRIAGRAPSATPAVMPTGAIEERLAEIWTELLGVEQVGAEDDFFELGGHSLLATRVLARVREAFGARLVLRDVFDAPTVRTLAAKIETGQAVERSSTQEDREELEF